MVDVLHHRVNVAVPASGEIDEQRRAERLLIHEALVEPSVLAHVEPLVGGVDNHRVVEHVVVLEILDDAPHIAVDGVDHAHVVVHVALVFPLGKLLAGKVLLLEFSDDGVVVGVPLGALRGRHAHVVGATPLFERLVGRVDLVLVVGHLEVVDHVHILDDAHFLLLGRQAPLIVVVEIVGKRIGHVVVEVEVARVGTPHAVGGLVVEEQAEGLRLVALVAHPVYGQVGDDVGHVALSLHGLSIVDEGGIVVVALTGEDVPIVEACWVAGEVPLADDAGFVAGLLQQFWKGLLAAVKSARVVGEPILVAVLAREQTGSRRP